MLFIHSLQLGLSVIVTCLDVYGVHYIPYNILICSLIIASTSDLPLNLLKRLANSTFQSVCTVPVCVYLIVLQCCFKRFYSPYTASAYHIWMLVFWLIDLSLIAHLAQLWQNPECTYDIRYKYMCVPYLRRDDNNRGGHRRTSFSTYYAALVAGALLAASEL
jgi:hypothetical protein